jgi:hypothetical protein
MLLPSIHREFSSHFHQLCFSPKLPERKRNNWIQCRRTTRLFQSLVILRNNRTPVFQGTFCKHPKYHWQFISNVSSASPVKVHSPSRTVQLEEISISEANVCLKYLNYQTVVQPESVPWGKSNKWFCHQTSTFLMPFWCPSLGDNLHQF